MEDPFRHHPNLRDKIEDPETSFLRTITLDVIDELAQEHGLPRGWWYSDEKREALRAETMKERWGQDLWIFGYGSLMWNPAIRFAEVRRGRIEGYSRQFVQVEEYGGRGTPEVPGLVATLDLGGSCDGLGFRIRAEDLDEETRILWQREMVAEGYSAVFLDAKLGDEKLEALAFVGDHSAKNHQPDLARDTQVTYLATGEGLLGTSADYLRDVVARLRDLRIDDAPTERLLEDVEARLAGPMAQE